MPAAGWGQQRNRQHHRPYGGIAAGALGRSRPHRRDVQDGAFRRFAGRAALAGPLGCIAWLCGLVRGSSASTGASEDGSAPNGSGHQRWLSGEPVRVSGGRRSCTNKGLRSTSYGSRMWDRTVRGELDRGDSATYGANGNPSLSPTTQLVALHDAIYLRDGTACLVFDAATGELTGRIDVPEDLESPWANLRVAGDYLVGSSGQHVLCINRGTGGLVWRVAADRRPLYLAAGGGKVFCSELPNPQRGEVEGRDGSIFALNLATGERLWRRAGGARLRYNAALDILVTAAGFYQGSSGEPLPRQADAAARRRHRWGAAEAGLPGYIAGEKLLRRRSPRRLRPPPAKWISVIQSVAAGTSERSRCGRATRPGCLAAVPRSRRSTGLPGDNLCPPAAC